MITETSFIFQKQGHYNLTEGKFTCKSPSNIALVKYWGKSEPQIPKNTSLSFTLNNCHTITTLEYKVREVPSDMFVVDIFFEGEKKEDFKPKILKFFERIETYLPFLRNFDFTIKTENSFPHSSGIASSASGMAALAICLMSMEKKLNPEISEDHFLRKSSFLARLGSGSASRSIEGPIVVWGKHKIFAASSDLYGIKFPNKVHENFNNYQDTILLVDKGEKQVSSTVGHNLMLDHPFAQQRFLQANHNISRLTAVLENGNLNDFINLVESEALTLHAMMMTSNPYFILMKANTLKIIEKIWEYRKNTKNHICFTLDAGANVHVLFPDKEKEEINPFILNDLVPFCQNKQYICDTLGKGSEFPK